MTLDYHLDPTLEEYSHILGFRIKDWVSFVSTKELPKSHLLAEGLHLKKKEVKLNLKPKDGTYGFTLKFLVERVIAFVDVGSWIAFNVVFALLIYGIMLFPSMEDFLELVSIHIFLSKNMVPTLLADNYYSLHGPFIENKDNLKRSQRIMSLTTEDIMWYSRAYDDIKLILSCGNFPNVPLIGTKNGINYNPRITLCQLGYPLICKPDSEHVEEFILYKWVDNPELLRKIVKAWRKVRPQGKYELGKNNCIAKEAYTQWVKNKVE
ncbi:uncharacterized protein LOC127135888 [Lathyrus oleraceus]|uniref:uncharacterized protein LOC127135888 n=1 Tax=Pisum sativum TaxID=3888 RepID=UPI0021D0EC1B|nr:uncharacterized protein LOC127135888 [Pisum sativum]